MARFEALAASRIASILRIHSAGGELESPAPAWAREASPRHDQENANASRMDKQFALHTGPIALLDHSRVEKQGTNGKVEIPLREAVRWATFLRMSKPKLLILIPAYNEELRIGPTLERFGGFYQTGFACETQIVVVLNGCRDNTLEVVRQSAVKFPCIGWTVFNAAIGKGGAIIEGLKLSHTADYIGFVDADGSTGPESFSRLVVHCLESGADCVVGSRRVPGSVIHQSQPSNRLVASKVFHFIVEVLFHMGIKDTQCGAKVMKREAVMHIHDSLHVADMSFDINLLYCLKRARYQTIEAPVEWTDHLGSTVRYFRTSVVMFLSVCRLRIIHSPLHCVLRWARPVEAKIYRYLRNPPPLEAPNPEVPTICHVGGESTTRTDS